MRDYKGRFGYLVCVNAHDRCDGADEDCQYCEITNKKLKEEEATREDSNSRD